MVGIAHPPRHTCLGMKWGRVSPPPAEMINWHVCGVCATHTTHHASEATALSRGLTKGGGDTSSQRLPSDAALELEMVRMAGEGGCAAASLDIRLAPPRL